MKNGDIFEFFDHNNKRSQPQHEFYDETLKKWISVGSNVFVCLAHVKNVEWKNSSWDYSLFFTDGNCLFHARVDVMRAGGPGIWGQGVSSARVIEQL